MDGFSSSSASSQVEPGKIFVGGLSWETTKVSLQEHFSKFGPVKESEVMVEPESGKPRGFGFITFVNPETVQAVLSEKVHVIDKKKVDPKPATVKGHTQQQPQQQQQQPGNSDTLKKIFVGGLHTSTKDSDVREYFQQYIQSHCPHAGQVEVKRAEARNAAGSAQTQQQQQQQQQQMEYYTNLYRAQQGYNPSGLYDYYAAAAAYSQYAGQYGYRPTEQYAGQQQTSAPPQQMGAGSYGGQDSTGVARSVGYSNPAAASTTGYTQYGQASGYDQGQMPAYQQQSYQTTAATTYSQSGQSNQYY